MQVVINIPQKLYKELTTVTVTHAGEVFAQKLIRYIKNGIPLPKGHGRLGDLDELTQRITNYIEHNEHMMDELTLLQEKFILEGIKETHAIIEADREVEER